MLETDHAGGKNDARGVLLKHFERKKYSKLQSDFYRVHRLTTIHRGAVLMEKRVDSILNDPIVAAAR